MNRPTREGHTFVFRAGAHKLVIDPEDGGRTIELSFEGRNALIEKHDSPQAYGSSFWPSPQRDWDWPPPVELDRERWSAVVDGECLILESRANEKLGVRARQTIRQHETSGVVSFDYEIHNVSQRVRNVAPWQNTRVPPGGLTFFPTNADPHGHSTLTLDRSGDLGMLCHDRRRHTQSGKAFSAATEGWIAHASADLVLVKTFPSVAPGRQAPGEAEIEIYVDGGGVFVEVEQQGTYDAIPPGKSSHWSVRWLLLDGRHGSNGSPTKELVARVRSAVREHGAS
jgi:hypothetical protein